MQVQRGRVNFQKISEAALVAASHLVPEWLSAGTRQGFEWIAPNPTRADRNAGSFAINLSTGKWSDFATGDRGSDLVSLYAYINGVEQIDAGRWLHERLGVPFDPPLVSVDPSASQVKVEKAPRTSWAPILPVPADAPPPHAAHIKRGKPQAIYTYRGADGAVLGYIYRFVKSDGSKETLPHCWCRDTVTGEVDWRWLSFAQPRPLYGLDALAAKPDAWVLLVEGEKCVDVAGAALPELAVASWPGGCKAVDKADFSPLAGRKVMLWPDADSQREKLGRDELEAGVDPDSKAYLLPHKQPGLAAMWKIGKILEALGCEVRIVDLPPPGSLPDGWDIADAFLVERRTPEQIKAWVKERLIPLQQACAKAVGDSAPAQARGSGETPDQHWRNTLLRTDEGGLRPILANAYAILLNDDQWRGVLAYDEFSQRIVKRHPPPWPGGEAGLWSDADASKALVWLQTTWRLMLKTSSAADEAARMVAWENRYHAIKQWLATLPVWDGIKRLPDFLPDVYGAEKTDYTTYIGQGFMVAAVARVMEPGCKVDEMVVLEGGQGAGKSTSILELASPEWYLETSEDPAHKDFYISLQGKWLIEIGEMNSFNKAGLNQVKQSVVRRDDTFRAPYDRYATSHKRQCVFLGTTNADEYLQDATGGRRFLPVRCNGETNLGFIRNNREQLWAEALHLYRSGFKWWDFPKEAARDEQDARFVADSWEEPISRYLDGQAPSEWYGKEHTNGPILRVSTTEILYSALRIDIGKHTRQDQMRVGTIMRRMNWRSKQFSGGKRFYCRPA